MQSMDTEVLNTAIKWTESEAVWLCTVLSTYGSSPRPPGTMMVIKKDGQYRGSLSGGCVEEDFTGRIRNGEYTAATQLIRYGDGGLTPDRALPCGGILDILIEYLIPEIATSQYLKQMYRALDGAISLRKVINFPDKCTQLEICDYSSSTITEYNTNSILLTVSSPPRIIIAGLSVVAVFCANFALSLGFETIVCDAREEAWLNHGEGLNAGISRIHVHPASYLEKYSCHSQTAIVSLTHDPRVDDLTMMEAVRTPAFYIGVMGSEKNSRNRLKRLHNIGELSEAELKRIHAPIGIPIGSKTPPEIAISVMSDIILAKNS